ncbi:GntR family transcriptional regulator [Zavarzinella formosa]|uniref:GntR family transcriptional regulator n=1 Tax=Zavarzinella formosa TaxID=360055 RepID=UPI0002F9DC34|nr:GntR family transcriptional regulator [Zavarzinella formosa]
MSQTEPLIVESGPKYVHLSEQLANRIRAGEWNTGKVPTVRDIASAYEVSSFTASRALHLLRDQGLIVTRERSGCYVAASETRPVAATEPAQLGRWAVVTRMSPGPWQSASEAVVRVGFARLEEEGIFDLQSLDVRADLTVGEIGKKVAAFAANRVEGVFYLPSRVSEAAREQDEWFLAACRREGLPVVLLDRNLRGDNRALDHDLVASDHHDGGFRCTEHLLGLGRKNVACVIASPTSAHNDRLSGYLYALETTGGGRPPRVIRAPEQMEAREAYPWIAAELIRLGVDGVICYQDYVAIGVILELFRRGVNVPRDVAVAGCDDLPIGQSFALGVTSYTYPSEALARTAFRVMTNRIAHPNDPPSKVVLPGILVVRDSTVPA